ncbi:ABC transporter substrate-binding protein [Deinococcus malanensis]|uniref:ABC transporter substrate-binding protein n=1 Tax=Deinococcus malanensis TaxID=1706855 RepID=A0ABQ2F134_9DEIO|nr:ABC transporter substrate-binding protein [Deinococcus malanensis]GGK38909.1 ABC transporter substrate-binding protein [Deinococcus malanensis]
MTTPRARFTATLPFALVVLLTSCFQADQSGAGDRLRVVMLQPPRAGLSPLSDDAFKLSRWSTAETLVQLDADGDPQPLLATAWTRLNATTWRFVLRPKVQFHDGTPLTADQVVHALTAATRAVPKPRILDGVTLKAEETGPHAVLVRTQLPDPLLPNRLSSPQLAILARKAYGPDGQVNPTGAGTGPFVLTDIQGTTSAHLDRFDRYWGEQARVAGIDADYVPDGTARAAALRTGTADVVEALPVSQVALLPPALVHEVPMPRTNTLYLNTTTGPLKDASLRAAIRDAVNRTSLVNTVYEGRADVAQGLLGPALPWAATLRTPVKSPTVRAVPQGEEITLATFSDRAELPEVAVLLAQQLTQAGFTVRQDVRQYAQIEADALAGWFDAFILSRATVLDSGDPVAYMTSDFSCAGSFNIAQLCDPAVEAALKRAAAALPGPDRRAAIMAAEAAILRTNAAVPLLHERVIQGEAARVDAAERDPRERRLLTGQTSLSADE